MDSHSQQPEQALFMLCMVTMKLTKLIGRCTKLGNQYCQCSVIVQQVCSTKLMSPFCSPNAVSAAFLPAITAIYSVHIQCQASEVQGCAAKLLLQHPPKWHAS